MYCRASATLAMRSCCVIVLMGSGLFRRGGAHILAPRCARVSVNCSRMEKQRIIVIGGGFAGLWAVRHLARAPVEITLIDRSNHHLFQPLLYQVATAGLAAPSIAAPLRHILRGQDNVTVLMGEVSRIDADARRVMLADREIGYDYLLVASGATH